MENIQFYSVENPFTGEKTDHVIIDLGNGEMTGMPKWKYDELQAQKNKIGVVTNGDN